MAIREIKIPITLVPNGASGANALTDALTGTKRAVDGATESLNKFDTSGDRLDRFARDSAAQLADMKKRAEDLQRTLDGLRQSASRAGAALSGAFGFGAFPAGSGAAGGGPGGAGGGSGGAGFFSQIFGNSTVSKIAATVVGITTLQQAVKAGIGAIKELTINMTDAAEVSVNMADRLGLSVGQVEKLQAMARIAGVNIATLESSARLLGNALDESGAGGNKTTEALQKLGISTRKFSGEAQDMGKVLLAVLTQLAKIPNDAERVARANDTLGRGAKELLPLIKNYTDLQKAVEELGVGLDENATRKLAETNDEIDKVNIAFNELKKSLSAKIAPVEIHVIKLIQEILKDGGGNLLANNAVVDNSFGGGKIPAINPTDDKAFGPANIKDFSRFGLDAANARQAAAGNSSVAAVNSAMQTAAETAKRQFDNTVEGMEARLKKLKETSSTLQSQLFSGNPLSNRSDKQSQFDQTETQIKSLEARIKSIKQLPEELKSLQRELARAQADELEGVEKINALRRTELELKGHTAQEQDLINRKFDIQIKQEIAKEAVQKRQRDLAFEIQAIALNDKDNPREAANKELDARVQAAEFELQTTGKIAKYQDEITAAVQKRFLTIAGIDSAEDDRARKEKQDSLQALTQFAIKSRGIGAKDEHADARIQADYEDRVRAIRAVEVRNDQDRVARRKSFADAAIDYELAKEELAAKRKAELDKFRIDQLKTAADYQIKVVEATAQPGQEQQVVERVAQIRITAAKEQYDLTHDRLQLEREVESALYEAQSKRLDMQKKALDDFKSAAGQLYDELLNKGGRGIGDFFKKQFEDAGRRVFENLAGKLFERLPGLPDMKDQAGGIFRDVWGPLGKGGKNAPRPISSGSIQSQAKAITDQYAGQIQSTALNTAATDRNTAALTRLTAQIASGAGLTGMGGMTGLGGLGGFGGISSSVGTGAAGGTQVSSTLMTEDGTVFGSGTTVTPVSGGFPNWNGPADYGGVGGYNPATGTMQQTAGAAAASRTSSLGKGLGTGVAIGAGALGIITGIKQGGARGAGQAVASGLGTAAVLDPEPVSKSILAGAAIVTGIITSMFGPNLAKRNAQIDKQIRGNAFFDRPTYERNEDAYGSNVDFDYRGGVRSGAPAAMNVTMHISALDAKGVMEMGGPIADALKYQILRGHTVVDEIRQATR